MHKIIEEHQRHVIFSYFTLSNLITLRRVDKAHSGFVLDYLCAVSPDAKDWQFQYIAELLTQSDEIFHGNQKELNLSRWNAMNLFYGMLFQARKQNQTLVISNAHVNVLLQNTHQNREASAFRLLRSLDWTLTKKQQKHVKVELESVIGREVLKVCSGNVTEPILEHLVYLKKMLTENQLYAIASNLIDHKTAQQFLYKKNHIFALFNEIKTGKIDDLVSKMFIAMGAPGENNRLNMLMLFTSCIQRIGKLKPEFIVHAMRCCIVDAHSNVRHHALQALDAYAMTLNRQQDKDLVLAIVKPLLHDKNKDICDLVIHIGNNHQSEFDFDAIMQFWRRKYLNDNDSLNPFFSKLNPEQMEQFIQLFVTSFSKEFHARTYCSLSMDLVGRLLKDFNQEQWQSILELMNTGLKSDKIDQQIDTLYLFKIIAGRMNEQELQLCVPVIIQMVQSKNNNFAHPLLELLENIPALMQCESNKNIFLDFIFETLDNSSPYTCHQALITLVAIKQELTLSQKMAFSRHMKTWLGSDFDAAIIPFKAYVGNMKPLVRGKIIADVLTLFPEKNSDQGLKFFNGLIDVLDPKHFGCALQAIQDNLQEKSNIETRIYALKMFFSCVEMYGQQCTDYVDLSDVFSNLKFFLNHDKPEFRRVAKEKAIVLLNSKLFSTKERNYCAQYFFGDTDASVEALYVNLTAQAYLKYQPEQDVMAIFETLSQHYLKKSMSFRFLDKPKSNPEAKRYTQDALNILHHSLHQMDPEHQYPEKRIGFIKQVKRYPVFSPILKQLNDWMQNIYSKEIGLWDFNMMDITEDKPIVEDKENEDFLLM